MPRRQGPFRQMRNQGRQACLSSRNVTQKGGWDIPSRPFLLQHLRLLFVREQRALLDLAEPAITVASDDPVRPVAHAAGIPRRAGERSAAAVLERRGLVREDGAAAVAAGPMDTASRTCAYRCRGERRRQGLGEGPQGRERSADREERRGAQGQDVRFATYPGGRPATPLRSNSGDLESGALVRGRTARDRRLSDRRPTPGVPERRQRACRDPLQRALGSATKSRRSTPGPAGPSTGPRSATPHSAAGC